MSTLQKNEVQKRRPKEVDADNYVSRHADSMEDFQCGYSYCKEQSPWISVKDKLPEPEHEVFLYDRDSVKHYAIGWLRKKKDIAKVNGL